jgi:hypothetical protein
MIDTHQRRSVRAGNWYHPSDEYCRVCRQSQAPQNVNGVASGGAVNESRSASDRDLDETLEETFPASDAPANTVATGTRVGPVPRLPAAVGKQSARQVGPAHVSHDDTTSEKDVS